LDKEDKLFSYDDIFEYEARPGIGEDSVSRRGSVVRNTIVEKKTSGNVDNGDILMKSMLLNKNMADSLIADSLRDEVRPEIIEDSFSFSARDSFVSNAVVEEKSYVNIDGDDIFMEPILSDKNMLDSLMLDSLMGDSLISLMADSLIADSLMLDSLMGDSLMDDCLISDIFIKVNELEEELFDIDIELADIEVIVKDNL